MFILGAFAIIFDGQGRVLLSLRRDMEMWNLPGGGLEAGELPTEAVIREVKEETELEVVIDHLVGVYGKPGRDELVFTFLCSIAGGKLGATEEASESRYFAVQAIPSNTIPKHVERIRDAVNFNGQPVFRRQTSPATREMLEEIDP